MRKSIIIVIFLVGYVLSSFFPEAGEDNTPSAVNLTVGALLQGTTMESGEIKQQAKLTDAHRDTIAINDEITRQGPLKMSGSTNVDLPEGSVLMTPTLGLGQQTPDVSQVELSVISTTPCSNQATACTTQGQRDLEIFKLPWVTHTP